MSPNRPTLHRAQSSITYHPSLLHKPVLTESPAGRSVGFVRKKWFVLVEYGPELDSGHSNGGTVLSFLQPTAHQQLVHTIPQLHIPSPTGLSLLLKVTVSSEAGPKNARVDDAIWPHLFAGFFLPDPGNDIRGLETYGHLSIAAHLILKVDTRKARWYESWWSDPMIGSLERWVDLDRYRASQDQALSPAVRGLTRPRSVTTPDPVLLRPEPSTVASHHTSIHQGAATPVPASEAVDVHHVSPAASLPVEPDAIPTSCSSFVGSRNPLSLSISVPSPAAWSNATSWGPSTTFSPYPEIEWMGSPGHVWTPDIGERAVGSVPGSPISGGLHHPDHLTALPHQHIQESSEPDRSVAWHGVWPFFRADSQDQAGGKTTAPTPSPPPMPDAVGLGIQGAPWDKVWPFFERKPAIDAPPREHPDQHDRGDKRAVPIPPAGNSNPIKHVVAPPRPAKSQVRSRLEAPYPVATVSRAKPEPVKQPEQIRRLVPSATHQAEVANHSSLFAGTMFDNDSIEAHSLASNLSPIKIPRALHRSPSPPHFEPPRRSVLAPSPERVRADGRVSGLPHVHSTSQTPTSAMVEQGPPLSGWRAPWDHSDEPPLPPIPYPSAPPRAGHRRGSFSSSSSSLDQTPAPSTTTASSTPLPTTPKRPFKRLSRSLSSSMSSFSEGGVDLSMPLNSPRKQGERTPRVSPSSSPTASENIHASVIHIGVAIVYPFFDIYPAHTAASARDLAVTIASTVCDSVQRPPPVDIAVCVQYPLLDIYPSEPPWGGRDIGAEVALRSFNVYAPNRLSPIHIGVSIVYPFLDIYPTPPTGKATVDIGVAIQDPDMTIYNPRPPKSEDSVIQSVVYPELDIYPALHVTSASSSVEPITLSQFAYPNIVLYPPVSSSRRSEPEALSMLLIPFVYPKFLLYPGEPAESHQFADALNILLRPFEYPIIIIYPKLGLESETRTQVAPVLLAPFDYPRIVLYPSQRTVLQASPNPVKVLLCQLRYPDMTIYPITNLQPSTVKPVLHRLNTTLTTPPRPPRRSTRSQTVSTINSVDLVKTTDSTISISSFRTRSHLPSPNSLPESPAPPVQEFNKVTIPDLPLQRVSKRLNSPFEALSEAHQSLTREPVQRRSTPARSTYILQSRPQRKSQADLFWAGVTGHPA